MVDDVATNNTEISDKCKKYIKEQMEQIVGLDAPWNRLLYDRITYAMDDMLVDMGVPVIVVPHPQFTCPYGYFLESLGLKKQ